MHYRVSTILLDRFYLFIAAKHTKHSLEYLLPLITNLAYYPLYEFPVKWFLCIKLSAFYAYNTVSLEILCILKYMFIDF